MGLGPDLMQWAEKAFYVQTLALADKYRTFPLFTDLPVELRANIYEYVCVSNTALRHPAQPPICRASKQLREEALPIFYGKNCFIFTVLGSCGKGPILPVLRDIDDQWLRDFRSYLPRVRKFTFELSKMNDEWIYQACDMYVELAPASNRCTAAFGRHKIHTSDSARSENLAGYLPGFMDALGRVLRPGKGFDLDAIYEVVDSMILAYMETATPEMQYTALSLATLFDSLW